MGIARPFSPPPSTRGFPAGAPSWAKKSFDRFAFFDTLAYGDGWKAAVDAWVQHEIASGLNDGGYRLPSSTHRPLVLSAWVKTGRSPTWNPDSSVLQDTDGFPQYWAEFVADVATKGNPSVAGPNGLTTMFSGMLFWRMKLGKTTKKWESLLEAITAWIQDNTPLN